MESKLIYVADDEKNIRKLVKNFLTSAEYDVKEFETGDLLYDEFMRNECDLVILDIMMPGSNGFEICTKLREKSIVPIIMLTARDTDADYIKGITLGSDDYFTKPFSPMSLVMRVKAIFRRIELEKTQRIVSDQEVTTECMIQFGDISIHLNSKMVFINEIEIGITPYEYNMLVYLFENKEKAVSREEILDMVWGYNSEVETRAADDTVKRLRKKLSDSNVAIETVWGFGFRLNIKEKN
ncbi:MAG TPA: response regulator transcription factor [Anaerovoracaceae bacterium]|nr:response regulator transcription factor [Anaerovoracaceae bacterium]